MDDFLPDEIIQNILARLPAKPLLRCRCVSKYWNRLITDPNFMKLRSRRTIIIPLSKSCLHIDDTPNSIFIRPYPLENLRPKLSPSRVIGTFNGIVLMAYSHTLILYNPITGAIKRLPHAPGNHVVHRNGYGYGYGFGYGANPNDLKIVRFSLLTDICNVYNLKNNSWSSWSTLKYKIKKVMFDHAVGTFLNGYLYWVTSFKSSLTVLDVKDMVLSEIHLPFKKQVVHTITLGSIHGCLCLLTKFSSRFDMWVMKKEHDVPYWSIRCSFNLTLEGSLNTCLAVCVLDSGRIVMVNPFSIPSDHHVKAVIYDTSNGSCRPFNISLSCDHHYIYYCDIVCAMEYVESLVSPSDMCSSINSLIILEKRKRT